MTIQPRFLYRLAILFLAMAVAIFVIARLVSVAPVSPSSELRKFTIIPPFTLTERSGRTITNQDLSGKIWVADFVYTTCPGPCPLVTASMAKIQKATEHDQRVQLVTFTVDPENDTVPVLAAYASKFGADPKTDTPDVLAKYADKFGADPNRWWFLTGPEKPLYHLIQDGFYQVVEDNRGQPLQEGQFTVTHSTKMVLVDGDGVMRGFYDGVGPDGRSELLKGIKTLEKESPE